jgi:hypothetical protein
VQLALQFRFCNDARVNASYRRAFWPANLSRLFLPAWPSHTLWPCPRASAAPSLSPLSAARQRHSLGLGGEPQFRAPFQFTVGQDKRATACTTDRLIIFQHFRIDQSDTSAIQTFEIIHHMNSLPYSSKSKWHAWEKDVPFRPCWSSLGNRGDRMALGDGARASRRFPRSDHEPYRTRCDNRPTETPRCAGAT